MKHATIIILLENLSAIFFKISNEKKLNLPELKNILGPYIYRSVTIQNFLKHLEDIYIT